MARCSETVDYCIAKQQQLSIMSLCPPAGHIVKHLGHDNRFISVWRQMTKMNWASHGMGWLKRSTSLRKTLNHNKRWQLFLLACKAFFVLPTHPVFHVHHTVDALAFVLSTSAREQPSSSLILDSFWFRRCGVASSLLPQSRTARTKATTSRAILLQPAPSKLFTTVVLFVSHSKKNSLHHRRLTR